MGNSDTELELQERYNRFFRVEVPMNVAKVVAPDGVEKRKEFLDAKVFKETIEPVEGVDYDWVWDYAKEKFSFSEALIEYLDNKANDIIKYLGGGTGLVTVAAISGISHANAVVIAWLLPAVAAALISIWLASMAREPAGVYYPGSVKSAFNFANHYGRRDKARACFLGQWHLACVSMRLAADTKGDRVLWATRFFFVAIALLSLPLIIAISRAW